MNTELLRKAVVNERIEWRKHVLQRIAERNIRQRNILDVILRGEMIQSYDDDAPYPSALFLAFVENIPIHVVASFDEANDVIYIITAYEPSLDYFEPDFKTRRKL